jgi:hypothetical protein
MWWNWFKVKEKEKGEKGVLRWDSAELVVGKSFLRYVWVSGRLKMLTGNAVMVRSNTVSSKSISGKNVEHRIAGKMV